MRPLWIKVMNKLSYLTTNCGPSPSSQPGLALLKEAFLRLRLRFRFAVPQPYVAILCPSFWGCAATVFLMQPRGAMAFGPVPQMRATCSSLVS